MIHWPTERTTYKTKHCCFCLFCLCPQCTSRLCGNKTHSVLKPAFKYRSKVMKNKWMTLWFRLIILSWRGLPLHRRKAADQRLTHTKQLQTRKVPLDDKKQHLPFSPVSSMDSDKSKMKKTQSGMCKRLWNTLWGIFRKSPPSHGAIYMTDSNVWIQISKTEKCWLCKPLIPAPNTAPVTKSIYSTLPVK